MPHYQQQCHRKQNSNKLNIFDQELSTTVADEDQFGSNVTYRMTNTTTDSIVDYLSDDDSESEMPTGQTLEMSIPVRRTICDTLDSFVSDDKAIGEIEFPSSLFCHERIFVRQQAQERNLTYKVLLRGTSRVIIVSKVTNESMSNGHNNNNNMNNDHNSNKQIVISLDNSQLMDEIRSYLQTCPISTEESDLLQAKIQKTPSSLNDWAYCKLLRSGNSLYKLLNTKTRIPDKRFLSNEQPIHLLPIDQTSTRENVLHLIETNKLIFISGSPSIGKSIRICQYLNDDYFDKRCPIRILHSCTNSIAAHSLSNVLSTFNQSIDCFTFENMSSFTSEVTSSVTITTHELLLHTLISGDYLLKSAITHLIVDDAHKRSHTLDMLLAYLKDTLHKFRHLKIILIQTSIQNDTLVKYFGSVPTYTIDTNGLINDDIDDIFLDRILIDIQHIDQNMYLSIANYGTILLDHWCRLVEQSFSDNRTSNSTTLESCLNLCTLLEKNMTPADVYLNNLIGKCFVKGLVTDFDLLLNYILQNPEKCNHQHPLTLVSPLMCISMWSLTSSIKRLLVIDGLLVDLRAINNFSAMDFAKKYATNETVELLESYITFQQNPLRFEQLLNLTMNNSSPNASIASMRYYLQTRKSDDVIDYELILLIINYFCQLRSGNIVLFLPGPDEISTFHEQCSNYNVSNQIGIEIRPIFDSSSYQFMLNEHIKYLFICDAKCEVGVQFRNVACVIDTGITVDKCLRSTASRSLLKHSWITKTSAAERKYRLNSQGHRVCYRLYSHTLFDDKITENINSEMARQPLLENIMQSKLFAWTACSVAEFMLKLPYPPPFAVVRAGITQLKNLELLDKWEDLIDLGAYSLALPVIELPYAMMIVYAHLFKCLQPILTIVSTLTIGDPFQLKLNNEHLLELKQKLSSNKNSDHFIFYELYQQWEKANDKKEFCNKLNVKYSRMKRIDYIKKWLTDFLVNIQFAAFFYSNHQENIDLNENSSCWPLIQAILVRCLPQNLITHDQQWLSNRNELVHIDSMSIFNNVQLSEKEKLQFAICDDIIRSNKGLFIGKYCTSIEKIVLLFFGTINDSLKLNDCQIILSDNSLFKLRTKLNACIKRKLQSLGYDNNTTNDYRSFHLLVKIFSNIK